jgi:uncharacterized protein YecE (DUF72 family)
MNQKNIFVGTSGYSYASWKNNFYPPKLGTGKWFQFYCEKFNTVELNNTFYRFPVKAHLIRLYNLSPETFVFSVKAHKIITHTLRLKNSKEKINEFSDIVTGALKEKLVNILFQFPPTFRYSEENMNNILNTLAGNELFVVEFRDSSWWENDTVEQFKKNKITFCNMSHPQLPESNHYTKNKFYLRMHGVPKLFESEYSIQKLKVMADVIPDAQKVFIYFNNTTFHGAVNNAFWIKNYLDKKFTMVNSISNKESY